MGFAKKIIIDVDEEGVIDKDYKDTRITRNTIIIARIVITTLIYLIRTFKICKRILIPFLIKLNHFISI